MEWLESLEQLCRISGRDIRDEAIGRSGKAMRRGLATLPKKQPWSIARKELKRCFSDVSSQAHAARKLEGMIQEPQENLRVFIGRYSEAHTEATGKSPTEEREIKHIY